MEKLAQTAAVRKNTPRARDPGPGDEMPPEYWQAVLSEAAGDPWPTDQGPKIRAQRLADIQQHLLRINCRRCGRTIEIQKADAIRLAGPEALWKDVSQRLLENTCTQRTGRLQEDGCWPVFE